MGIDSILGRISEGMLKEEEEGRGSGMSVAEIGDIIEANAGSVNCYPGKPSGACHDKAYFISLTSKRYAKGAGHLSFRKAIERLVQHMQGHCVGFTKDAIVICDSWDPDVIDDWRSNIDQIKRTARIQAYLVSGNNISKMNI